ncbi:MAG: phage portal protein [Pisciglobus halotolerans]|nr:phage portal protein [Pisciglobus halotolerans]MDN6670669.1 phage portal protein [Staphylococcus equorum]
MKFILPRDKEITIEVVADLIEQHQLLIPLYLEDKNMYEGIYDILTQEEKELGKPDNRLVVNFAKYIVDISEGFFIGIPVKVTHEDERVNEFVTEFRNMNSMADKESELSKVAAIYGHSFEYLYQDEEAHSKVVYNSPLDMFLIYDDSIEQKVVAAVRYFLIKDELHGELITGTEIFQLGGTIDDPTFNDSTPHYYGEVPVIEYVQNEERHSVFEPVKTLINGLNKALSEKANDVDYFADAYMKIIGALLDEDTIKEVKDNRIINLAGDGAEKVVVEFMEKPNADETQENLIDRLIDLIYQMSMTANMNDEAFSGTISGVAMEYKLQGMKSMSLMKERKFQGSMQKRYRMLFRLPTNVEASKRDEWSNIRFQFTRNIPKNLELEAETMAKMEGVTSKETQLGVSSLVDEPKKEIERMQKEEEPEPVYDFEK